MARSAPESQQAAAVSDGRGGAGGVEWGAPGTTQGSGGFWVGAVFLPGESWALCPRKLFPAIAPSVAIATAPPHPRRKEAGGRGGLHSWVHSPSPPPHFCSLCVPEHSLAISIAA